MASALQQLCGSTVNITEEKHDDLIRQSEQLRILKNYIRHEDVIVKADILTLLEAMEEKEAVDIKEEEKEEEGKPNE